MTPKIPRLISTSAQAWEIMHADVMLRYSLMVKGFNEQLHQELLGIDFEQRQKNNASYYFPARVEVEIRSTDERATALYEASCEVWEIHGLKRNRAFYRAIFDNCLTPLFANRRDCVAADLTSRDERLGTPGHSDAAIQSLARRMRQLRSKWNSKLEIATREIETRERVALDSSDQLPKKPIGRKQKLEPEFTAFAGGLWKQSQSPTRVSLDSLLLIAEQLDSMGHTPPGKYLEAKAATSIRKSNSKNARSKHGGPIRLWTDLVRRGDKDDHRAMRRLLSRCAAKNP